MSAVENQPVFHNFASPDAEAGFARTLNAQPLTFNAQVNPPRAKLRESEP